MRRDFVDFIINHPVANIYRDFAKDMAVPDEHFYATLARIENIQLINVGYVFKYSGFSPNGNIFF